MSNHTNFQYPLADRASCSGFHRIGLVGAVAHFQYPLADRASCSLLLVVPVTCALFFQYPLADRASCSLQRFPCAPTNKDFQYPLADRASCSEPPPAPAPLSAQTFSILLRI